MKISWGFLFLIILIIVEGIILTGNSLGGFFDLYTGVEQQYQLQGLSLDVSSFLTLIWSRAPFLFVIPVIFTLAVILLIGMVKRYNWSYYLGLVFFIIKIAVIGYVTSYFSAAIEGMALPILFAILYVIGLIYLFRNKSFFAGSPLSSSSTQKLPVQNK